MRQEWRDEVLEELAQITSNGRKIRNVPKSAVVLAARKKESVGREYVDRVLALEADTGCA